MLAALCGEQERKALIMRTYPTESVDPVIAAWRNGSDLDSPAGPLFTGGRYAESEITMNGRVGTGRCGTVCSGSQSAQCC